MYSSFVKHFSPTTTPRILKPCVAKDFLYRKKESFLLLILLFICPVCFQSNENFVRYFTAVTAPGILKVGTNIEYDLYCRKENWPAPVYTSIFLSNHLGMFEIWPERCCALIKKELKYTGPFGLAAVMCNSVFIDRLNTKKALDTMKATLKEIKEKKVSSFVNCYTIAPDMGLSQLCI